MTIPITFEFAGKTYSGYFSQVSGSGSTASFHLTVNGMHWGRLTYIEGNPGFDGGLHSVQGGWRFTSNLPGMEAMADVFGDYVTAWTDSHYLD